MLLMPETNKRRFVFVLEPQPSLSSFSQGLTLYLYYSNVVSSLCQYSPSPHNYPIFLKPIKPDLPSQQTLWDFNGMAASGKGITKGQREGVVVEVESFLSPLVDSKVKPDKGDCVEGSCHDTQVPDI